MKLFSTLFFCSAIFFTIGCYESKPAPKYPIDGATNMSAPATNTASNTAAGVQHYICPNNCDGSGGAAAGTCPVCGTAYVHNDAFHNQAAPANNATTTESASTNINFSDPNAAPEPAQNAAGVWHYTCANGCEGGAGAAGTCPKCGGQLAHNAAYHN